MGDKYIPVPNDLTCPGSPWPDQKVPPYVRCVFSGIQTGTSWLPEYGTPFTGEIYVPFTSCGNFIFSALQFVSVPWAGTAMNCAMWGAVGPQQFLAFGTIANPLIMANSYTNPALRFYGGQVLIETYLGGWHYPPSWQGGLKFDVPTKPGFFSEEFTPSQYSRFTRTSSHLDGSNLHIIGDF